MTAVEPAERALKAGRALRWLGVAIAAVVSLPALFNAPVYDDEVLIFNNAFVRDLRHLSENLGRDFFSSSVAPLGRGMGYYRPLMKLGFALEYQLFGESAVSYHALSVVALLVIVSLGAALARRTHGSELAAGIGAVLFASHPVCASVVSTIASQSDLFAAIGMLGTLYACLRYHAADAQRSRAWLWLALASETIALGCKEVALVTPLLAAAALTASAPSVSKPLGDRAARRTILALGAPIAIYVALRVGLGVMPVRVTRLAETSAVSTAGKLACSALLRAMAPTVWNPVLHTERPLAGLASFVAWVVPALLAALLSCFLFARLSRLRLFIALIWCPLLPLMLGESMIHATADPRRLLLSDRWLLLTALAMSFVIGAALGAVLRSIERRSLRAAALIAIGCLVVTQSLLAFEANASFASENQRALYLASIYREHGVESADAKEIVLAADAILAERRGDVAAAVRAYAELLALDPSDLLRHYNLAVALKRAGRVREAYAEAYLAYHGASEDGRLQIAPNDSSNRRKPERALLLGQLAAAIGEGAAAEGYLRESLTLRPGNPAALAALRALEANR